VRGDGSALANSVVPVKHGEKTKPWEVDSITGATISSVAIANLLDRSAQYWVPRIRRNLSDFQGEE
ncbi:MAG: FMN-binding protein, partial [Polyangiales bacterium]